MSKRNHWSFITILTFVLLGCIHAIAQPVPVEQSSAQVNHSLQGIPILMYHSIEVNPKNNLMVAPTTFEAEMRHLQNAGYHTLTFFDLSKYLSSAIELPPKPVLVTFDDGYKNNFTVAYPILKKLKMKATVFVITGNVGNKNSLTWDQIREMSRSGVFEIGGHSKSHLDLTKLPLTKLSKEIVGSKQVIESQIYAPVIAFSYPAGRFNDAVVKATSNAGFEFAVTTRPGTASEKQGMLTLHRVRVPGNESANTFARLFP